jgi:hypothetical protein
VSFSTSCDRDKVLVCTDEINACANKLATKNQGPYEILEQLGPVNFRLKMPHGSKVHPVFHASKLLPYHTDTIGDRNPLKPTPLKVKGHDEYLVEEVLDS